MRILVADTFARSLERLDARSQRAVKCAAFDFQTRPASPGLSLHRLVHAVDRGFWSLRVTRDVRLIVHRSGDEAVLCFAAHHDEAYAWAEQRRLRRRPDTGEIELIEPAERPVHLVPRPTQSSFSEGAAGPDRFPSASQGAGAARTLAPPAPLDLPGPGEAAPATGSPRRLRVRRRAVAPLGVSRSRPAARPPPSPLAQLLRLAMGRGPGRGVAADPGTPHALQQATAPAGDRRTRLSLGATLRWVLGAGAVLAGSLGGLAASLAFSGLAMPPRLASIAGCAAGAALLAGLLGLVGATALRGALRRAAAELGRLGDALRAGRLGERSTPGAIDPALRPLARAVDDALDALTGPLRETTEALGRLAAGELPLPAHPPAPGELARQRQAIEALAAFLALRAEDLRAILASSGASPRRAPGTGQAGPAGAPPGRAPPTAAH